MNTGLDFLLLNMFVFLLGAIPLVANVISVSIGISISYLLNHYFVFSSEEKVSLRKFFMFFVVTGFSSLFIQSAIIIMFEAFFQTEFSRSLFIIKDIAQNEFIELNIAKVTAVLIGMVWNFMLYKHFIFKAKTKKGDVVESDLEDLA